MGVWLVTGAQASGKSTVAELLAQSTAFDRAVHVRGGQFARAVVRGRVDFDDAARPDEARRLLDLRYRLSALVADEFAAAGFEVVVQDNIYGPDAVRWLASVRARPRSLVVLRPSVAVVAAREAARRDATGKVAYRGSYTPADNDRDLATTPAELGLWLDTSSMTAEETVAEVLARREEALVA